MPHQGFGQEHLGHGHFGYGPIGGGSSLLLFGLSTLFWLALPLLIGWLAVRASARQPRVGERTVRVREVVRPSAIELARTLYVQGEIDVLTLEELLGPLLLAEQARERERRIREIRERGALREIGGGRLEAWEKGSRPALIEPS